MENSPLYLIPSLRAVKGWGSRGMGRWVGILGMIKPSLSSLWPDSTGCKPESPSPLLISLLRPLPRILPSLSSWEQQGSHWHLQGCSLYLRFLFTSSLCNPLTCLHFPFLLNHRIHILPSCSLVLCFTADNTCSKGFWGEGERARSKA